MNEPLQVSIDAAAVLRRRGKRHRGLVPHRYDLDDEPAVAVEDVLEGLVRLEKGEGKDQGSTLIRVTLALDLRQRHRDLVAITSAYRALLDRLRQDRERSYADDVGRMPVTATRSRARGQEHGACVDLYGVGSVPAGRNLPPLATLLAQAIDRSSVTSIQVRVHEDPTRAMDQQDFAWLSAGLIRASSVRTSLSPLSDASAVSSPSSWSIQLPISIATSLDRRAMLRASVCRTTNELEQGQQVWCHLRRTVPVYESPGGTTLKGILLADADEPVRVPLVQVQDPTWLQVGGGVPGWLRMEFVVALVPATGTWLTFPEVELVPTRIVARPQPMTESRHDGLGCLGPHLRSMTIRGSPSRPLVGLIRSLWFARLESLDLEGSVLPRGLLEELCTALRGPWRDHLRALNLNSTNLTGTGMALIRGAIEHNKVRSILTELRIAGNALGLDGLVHVGFLLAENRTIRMLEVDRPDDHGPKSPGHGALAKACRLLHRYHHQEILAHQALPWSVRVKVAAVLRARMRNVIDVAPIGRRILDYGQERVVRQIQWRVVQRIESS